MTPAELSRTVLCAVRRAVEDGELRVAVPERAVVSPPGPGGRGDYATNIALRLARPAGRAPLDVAEILRPLIREAAGVADVEITGPGFLNIHLERATATAALVREILQRPRDIAVGANAATVISIGSSATAGSDSNNITTIGNRGNRGNSSKIPTAGNSRNIATTGNGNAGNSRNIATVSQDNGTQDNSRTNGNPSPETHPPGTEATPPTPYGHTPTLTGQVIPLRIPYDIRAEVVADTLVRIIATQGGRAEVQHARAGEAVDLRPVPAPEDPAPLGPDAARWALLHPAAHDRPRITADHLLQRESNPLFRVRYAHARARALGRNAGRLGFDAVPGDVADAASLTRALGAYPHALTQAAVHRAPDRLARHLVAVADGLLAFQHTVLPLGDEKPSAAHRARLALAEAAGTVLAGGLSLLGISAPDYL
ncbi:ArgS-related anticodon-binding protein NrtL [Streptomyces sp. NPDC093261]|uniref:ArgS-related anticodon-binding protein NrtL n=1 Tax=Streptomyces sp. NPDC093261 TaxID=3366037 RepID=UPI00381B4DF1